MSWVKCVVPYTPKIHPVGSMSTWQVAGCRTRKKYNLRPETWDKDQHWIFWSRVENTHTVLISRVFSSMCRALDATVNVPSVFLPAFLPPPSRWCVVIVVGERFMGDVSSVSAEYGETFLSSKLRIYLHKTTWRPWFVKSKVWLKDYTFVPMKMLSLGCNEWSL